MHMWRQTQDGKITVEIKAEPDIDSTSLEQLEEVLKAALHATRTVIDESSLSSGGFEKRARVGHA